MGHQLEFLYAYNSIIHVMYPFQVMSVGIDSEGIDLFPSSDQLIYRIYTDHSLGLLPNENEYATTKFFCVVSLLLSSCLMLLLFFLLQLSLLAVSPSISWHW